MMPKTMYALASADAGSDGIEYISIAIQIVGISNRMMLIQNSGRQRILLTAQFRLTRQK